MVGRAGIAKASVIRHCPMLKEIRLSGEPLALQNLTRSTGASDRAEGLESEFLRQDPRPAGIPDTSRWNARTDHCRVRLQEDAEHDPCSHGAPHAEALCQTRVIPTILWHSRRSRARYRAFSSYMAFPWDGQKAKTFCFATRMCSTSAAHPRHSRHGLRHILWT